MNAVENAVLPLRPPIIVHHMGALDGTPYPPNSLEAAQACLEADADCVEIDVTALAADDFLLVHDDVLENETSGTGAIGACTLEQARSLSIRHKGKVTDFHVPLLSDVVELFRQVPGRSRLQIDFKNVLPTEDDELLRRLVRVIEPLGERVIVSTYADWHLRRLRTLAPWLDLGFDTGMYLDYRPSGGDARMPPFRVGAYGYHDDHILGTQQLLSTPRYLEERCEMLHAQIPTASVWYVNYRLLICCLDDGFNMARWLHERGVKLDAWTLDAPHKGVIEYALRLLDAGVDQFTTNTPVALFSILNDAIEGM